MQKHEERYPICMRGHNTWRFLSTCLLDAKTELESPLSHEQRSSTHWCSTVVVLPNPPKSVEVILLLLFPPPPNDMLAAVNFLMPQKAHLTPNYAHIPLTDISSTDSHHCGFILSKGCGWRVVEDDLEESRRRRRRSEGKHYVCSRH